MKMEIGRGLSMVAKRTFEAKVRTLANPVSKFVSYDIVDGKIRGVKLDVLVDAVQKAGHSFQQTVDKLYISKR